MGKKKTKNQSFDTQSEVSSLGGSINSKSTFKTNLSDCEDEPDFYDEDMKFKEMAEDISNKNAKKSLPGLKFVKARMQKEFMISFLTDYKETLSTELYRALRKSKGEFQSDIFKSMAVLFLSISPDDASQIFHDVQRELIVSISASKKGSALCLAIASAVQFIPEDVFKSTDAIRKIISSAFIKGDDTVPVLKSSQTQFITECIDAWKFIIAASFRLPGFGRFVQNEIEMMIDSIFGILQQTDVELRIATGEALSVIYEICREYNGEEWEGFEIDEEIILALEDLASGVAVGGGSVKDTAKKERKAQRTSFRHILEFIRDYEDPPITTLTISRQRLELDNFCDLNKYEILCWCLEGGILNHMSTNELLRSDKWFGLGAIIPAQTSLDKPNKSDKLEYRVQQKYVTKSRDAIIKQNRRHAQDDHYYD